MTKLATAMWAVWAVWATGCCLVHLNFVAGCKFDRDMVSMNEMRHTYCFKFLCDLPTDRNYYHHYQPIYLAYTCSI